MLEQYRGLSGGTETYEERQQRQRTGALAQPLDIYFTISHCCRTEGESEQAGGREGGGKKKKSVLDLIFHTPASYKRLSYTTLAPNNQSGKGSQNDEIPCHLLPDLFSQVARRGKEKKKKQKERKEREEVLLCNGVWTKNGTYSCLLP